MAFDCSHRLRRVTAEHGWGQAWEVGDEAFVEGSLERRQGRGEQSGVGKGDQLGRLGRVVDEKSLVSGTWGGSVGGHSPEAGDGIALAGQDELGAEEDGDGGGSEVCFTAGITELADGEQRLATEGREQVGDASSRGKVRKVEVGHVCGAHGSVIGKVDDDRARGGTLVAEAGRIDSKEVTGAARVSNERGGGGGRRT
jgi:hypothetical protein